MAWPNGYDYRKKITINNSSNAENFTNFVITFLINSSSDIDFADVQSTLGYDVVFYDSNDSTVLDFERVSWNDGANTAEFHIEVPQIDASSSTDFIYTFIMVKVVTLTIQVLQTLLVQLTTD